MIDRHLNQEDLSLALVDSQGLPQEVRAHLEQCTQCRAALAGLEAGLGGLGVLARRTAPIPPRHFSLPQEDRGSLPGWVWKGALTACLASAAALVMSFWLGPLAPPLPGTQLAVGQHPWLMEQLIETDIEGPEDLLAGMGLGEPEEMPGFQRFTLGDGNLDLEEGFMDFVSPVGDEEYSWLREGIRT